MKRAIALATCCLLLTALAACSKKAAESDEPAPAAQPAATTAAPAPPAEAAPVEITDDMVAKYLEYQKVSFALIEKHAEEARKKIEAAKGDTAKTLALVSEADKANREFEASLAAKRREMGLGDAAFAVVKEGAEMIATSRALYNQMGGDAQVARIEAEQKQQIAKLPAEQRAAAEAQMAQMTKAFYDARDGADVRKKFGDKSADALLRHADALATQYWEGLKKLAGK